MDTEDEPRTVQAVHTAVAIIEVLQKENSAGVTKLAETLDLSKASVHAHLTTLLQNELVVNDGGEYQLSLRHLDLGETVKSRLSYYDVMQTELDELAAETKELAQFATEEHGRAVYVYKTQGEKAVRTASSVGSREYMHCIALGKAMLAYMPSQRVGEIIDRHGLTEYTDATITSREELIEELETIREQGYAFDREEKIEGLRCVAAPVVTEDGLIGAVSVSGPARRVTDEFYREELPGLVTRAANVIQINSQFS